MIWPGPSRGEVWQVNLDPPRGHEQGGHRPGLVISDDIFNRGPAGIVVIIPITSRERGSPLHVRADPPDGGLTVASFIKCEDLRSVSKERLSRRWGAVLPDTMAEVEDKLRIFLNL